MAVPTATDEDASSGANEDEVDRPQAKAAWEPRPLRPFKSGEEYLYAMKEDLAEWLQSLYEDVQVDADRFFEVLDTGVVLCRHANHVLRGAREAPGLRPCWPRVTYRTGVQPGTFQARDNVSQFIGWCRGWLRVKECLLFETDDLVERKNERNVVLCLLEVARRGCDLCEGMPAPMLVQMEREIDAEVARDEAGCRRRGHLARRPSRLLDAATMTSATSLGVIESSDDGGNGGHEADDDDRSEDDGGDTTPNRPQVITNDLRSLHQRVAALLNLCTCPSQFPMIRVADGKYRIGDTQVLIFVRVLRNHVMVRVGGGWDTLEHYLEKHDPCRGRMGRRLSSAFSKTKSGSQKQLHSSHSRPRSCGTPSGNPPLTSPSYQRRRSLDFSTRMSSPDDARSSSLCSSRTPSRGSSPRASSRAEDDEFRLRRLGHGRHQYQSDCSSSEVSEEGGDYKWRRGYYNPQRRSPRKIMRMGENGPEESEVDSIYSSSPRSLDSSSRRRKETKSSKSSSLVSDDSAVSLETVARAKTKSTPRSKIPKSQTPQSQKDSSRPSNRLSASRSEASLFSSYGRSSQSASPVKERPSSRLHTRKTGGNLPRSSSGNSPFVPSARPRRSVSATRPSTTPSRENPPMTPNRSGVPRVVSCQSSPSKPVAPLLEEILQDSEHLDTDEKLLLRMEQLIDAYRCRARSEEEWTEDTTTACFSLSLDDDDEVSSLRSLVTYPKVHTPNRRTKSSANLLRSKSPSKIPVFTAWQVKDS